MQTHHVSVTINRSPKDVYAFVSNPENLPEWATGLGGNIKKVGGDWVANSPLGKIKIKMAPKNKFGVLDHDVITESGEVFHNPMRVVPREKGSEITFSLLQRSGVTDEKFAEDIRWVEKDLGILKSLLEK